MGSIKKENLVVEVSAKNIESLKILVQQKNIAQDILNKYITAILDTKDIKYEDAQVEISEDFTKLIVTENDVKKE